MAEAKNLSPKDGKHAKEGMRAKILGSFHADDWRSLMCKNFNRCNLLNVARRNICHLLRMIAGILETQISFSELYYATFVANAIKFLILSFAHENLKKPA